MWETSYPRQNIAKWGYNKRFRPWWICPGKQVSRLLWWLRCLLTSCHMRTLCPFLLKDAVFKAPSWEKYWFSQILLLLPLSSECSASQLWREHSGLRKSVSSRYSVTDARRYTEIYLTYCHRGMGGLNSANTLYYRIFNWGKREASPVMAEQELGVLH